MVSEGNGQPVDAAGWLRLRTIRGAGDRVPAKVGRIGVKNHGLKTAFMIGDSLDVLSDGKRISQTLRARGLDAPPYPGASSKPVLDVRAPVAGCRIIVHYRQRRLEPREGEALALEAVSDEDIERLFHASCATLPEQFLGIVCPEMTRGYEIVLRHWRCGEAIFRFSAGRPRRLGGSIVCFRRRCVTTGTTDSLPPGRVEDVARRLLPLDALLRRRTADHFRRGRRLFCEVSWHVDRRGRPQRANGRFRYPIGYPQGVPEACTGHGVSYNAPFVSDTERHAPVWEDAANIGLRAACDSLLIDVLKRQLVPRWGPHAMRLLVPSEVPHAEEQVRSLLAALARRGAIPTLRSAEVINLLGGARSSGRRQKRAPAVGESSSRKYAFIIPILTSSDGIFLPLAITSPAKERQIDPRVDPEIIGLLADGKTPGFPDLFLTFDETDALSRVKGEGNRYFDAPDDLAREMSDPIRAYAYLDIIAASAECEEKGAASQVQGMLLLPDARGHATEFHELFSSAPLPTDIPGLRIPPLLHPVLAAHPLFRQKSWRLPRFTLATFLAQATLDEADESTRRRFWEWLNQYPGRLSSSERTRLAEIAIWPDTDRQLRPLRDLCAPRSARMAQALGDSIRRPCRQVLKSRIVAGVRSGPASLRRSPTPGELDDFFKRRLAAFVIGDIPDEATLSALRCFEADLSVLVRALGVRRLTQGGAAEVPAIAKDASLRLRRELVKETTYVARLALPARFVLSKTAAPAVERISPARANPSADMLEAALREDAGNADALQARLEAVLAVTARGDSSRERLAEIVFIPCNGRLYAPTQVALRGTKGDYWGSWKTVVPTTGLPQDAQRRYLEVGVTSANPQPETSKAFFSWLAEQDSRTIASHVPCVIRHLLSPSGPASWAADDPDLPVVAVECANTVGLATLRDLRRKRIYLPDHDVAEQMRGQDAVVSLAITSAREVREPATEVLRRLGVKSLAEAIGDPHRVEGLGTVQKAAELLECLRSLQSPKLERTLLKRLDSLGVERIAVWRDWRDRIMQIRSVESAVEVQAKYRFLGKTYRVTVDAGLDRDTHVFWVADGEPLAESRFYEAVAARCVFKPGARPVYLLALQRAVGTQIADRSFGRPDVDADEQQEEESERSGEGATGESVFGHSPFQPDPDRNTPTPRPIPTGDGSARSGGAGGARRDGNRRTSRGRAPAREQEQIEALKAQHYASHCQMCLCERSPTELAPNGSYVQWEEVRRRVVEAHHVDPKAGGGARHAGNLVLLCKFHHDNYGRRFVREWIVEALEASTERHSVCFDPADDTSVVEGRVARLVLPDSGEAVSLFFTDYHAEYWLERAAESEPAGIVTP